MEIDLSPGDWAGVYEHLRGRAKELREVAVKARGADVRQDLREQAVDLDRIVGIVRDAIAENGRELPELVPGEPGDEPLCPHVWTEDDVARMREQVDAYNGQLVELHGEAANLWVREYPEAGTACGSDMQLVEEGYSESRSLVEWCEPTDDGVVRVGDTRFSDEGNGTSYVECNRGHVFAAPDINYW